MRTEIKDFKREELFHQYNSRTSAFSFVTTNIDITNLYKLGKLKGTQYGVISYYISKVVNTLDTFKMRYEDGKFIYYDVIHPNFTEKLDDDLIGFFDIDYVEDLDLFIKNYKERLNKFKTTRESFCVHEQDAFWQSCQPWYSFTSCVPPFDNSITIPQFIWDKFRFEGDRVFMNLMVMTHHGFVDGYQIGLFINRFQEEINNIKINEE